MNTEKELDLDFFKKKEVVEKNQQKEYFSVRIIKKIQYVLEDICFGFKYLQECFQSYLNQRKEKKENTRMFKVEKDANEIRQIVAKHMAEIKKIAKQAQLEKSRYQKEHDKEVYQKYQRIKFSSAIEAIKKKEENQYKFVVKDEFSGHDFNFKAMSRKKSKYED